MELLLEAIKIREKQQKIDLKLEESLELLNGFKECGMFVTDPNLKKDIIDSIVFHYKSLDNLIVMIKNRINDLELEILELKTTRERIACQNTKHRKIFI